MKTKDRQKAVKKVHTLNAILSVKKVRKAIEGSGGVKSIIAKRCGVSRVGFWKWLQTHPEMHDEIQHAREARIDMAEINMFKLSEEGDFNANKYILDTLGRSRGYGSRTEIDINQKSINVNIEMKPEDIEELTEFLQTHKK
jgi:hypothetical protein